LAKTKPIFPLPRSLLAIQKSKKNDTPLYIGLHSNLDLERREDFYQLIDGHVADLARAETIPHNNIFPGFPFTENGLFMKVVWLTFKYKHKLYPQDLKQ